MRNWLTSGASQSSQMSLLQGTRMFKLAAIAASFVVLSVSSAALAQEALGGEANLKLPDPPQRHFLSMAGTGTSCC